MNNTTIRKRMGYYSVSDLADILGVSYPTLRYAIKTGTIPSPTHQISPSKWRFYKLEDIERIKSMFLN